METGRRFRNEFLLLNAGFILLSFTIVNFLLPSKLTAGGTTGIAMILYHIYSIPVSWGFFLLNIPLVVMGYYIFGGRYGLKTIYGIIAISIYTEAVSRWMRVDYLEEVFHLYPLIGALTGGVLSGVGVGLAVATGGNTGGTTILAQIIEKYFKVKIGTTLNIADISIVALSGILLGRGSALFTILSLFICGRVVNIIRYREGWSYEGDT
ncbi:hypothetical protein PM10SUCC1_26700 [Propionigenium maris DSM 9537]|uniref:YitT family protein n=1 Tax=Propionigenium maris DSM 9537 TaxID=1123000 RepID=A0A9W6GNX0_9FUSO|nr:YitT family protein [Propionigenium maris]GLI57156.1 hypothetical protein PM10SUCC1_26700 [Propionigenium maris DSM 9537]